MNRATKSNNEIYYNHMRSVILLVVFTVLMAALTCLFAYMFDQITGIGKPQTLNQLHRNTRLPTMQTVSYSLRKRID